MTGATSNLNLNDFQADWNINKTPSLNQFHVVSFEAPSLQVHDLQFAVEVVPKEIGGARAQAQRFRAAWQPVSHDIMFGTILSSMVDGDLYRYPVYVCFNQAVDSENVLPCGNLRQRSRGRHPTTGKSAYSNR